MSSQETELTTLEMAQALQEICVTRGRAPVEASVINDYRRYRQQLMADPQTRSHLPAWVRTSRSPDQIWSHLRQFGRWADRDAFIWEAFGPLLDALEVGEAPAQEGATESLEQLDEEWVSSNWRKALERRGHDPEGAITAARSFVEDVCKKILEERGIAYVQRDDLPRLYRSVAGELRLSPDQHTLEPFRQILDASREP